MILDMPESRMQAMTNMAWLTSPPNGITSHLSLVFTPMPHMPRFIDGGGFTNRCYEHLGQVDDLATSFMKAKDKVGYGGVSSFDPQASDFDCGPARKADQRTQIAHGEKQIG